MELYQALVQFRDSNLDPLFVREADDDRIVQITRVNDNKRGKSLVTLRFTEEEYMKIFIDDKDDWNNNASVIAACENRYSGNLFVDSYWGTEEVRGGYVFHYFNEENLQLLRNIFKLINPSLANFEVSNPEDAGDFFYKVFQDEADEIGYYYADYYDDALRTGCLEYVNRKLCGKFDYYGIIEKSCRENYLTTVDMLISFWNRSKTPHDASILDMLKNFVEQNNLEFNEDLYEDYHVYWDNENWNGDSFNKEVNRNLEKVYERLTEDMEPEELENLKKFYVMLDKLNIQIGNWSVFPKQKTFGKLDPNKIFQVSDFEDGKIKVLYKKDKNNFHDVQKMLIPVEDFANFLYHPELF
jgi:hypothetical protein